LISTTPWNGSAEGNEAAQASHRGARAAGCPASSAALEAQLVAAPAENWEDAAEKAHYLLNLFASTQDPRRQRLIAAVLDDFRRLSGEPLRPDAVHGTSELVGLAPPARGMQLTGLDRFSPERLNAAAECLNLSP
jgi:hypothetical protein